MERKKVAVPSMYPGGLDALRSGHFGHCDLFTMVHLEEDQVVQIEIVENPPHQQGGCQAPVNLLRQNQADALIVGGIGLRPLMGFQEAGINVYYGPYGETVGSVIDDLVQGRLQPIRSDQVCGGGRF